MKTDYDTDRKVEGIITAILCAIIMATILWTVPATAHEFNWQPPEEFTDGSPLDPATDLDEYRLYCDGEDSHMATFSGQDTSATVPFPEDTEHSCFLTAVDTTGDESAASNTVNFTEPAKIPNAPVLLE